MCKYIFTRLNLMRNELKLLWEKWKREKSLRDISSFIENRLVPWLLLHIARWDSTTALHLGDLKKLALFLFGIIIIYINAVLRKGGRLTFCSSALSKFFVGGF
jgi:hypothetical protein